MPIYEWECESCNNIFETITMIDDVKIPICPKCNQLKCKRIMSALGRIDNFEAYYETDIDDKSVLVRTRQDLKDAIAKHNDGELADKVGTLAPYDPI